MKIDLVQLSQRESEQTEWKENVADIDDVVETLSAFANDLANLGGGYVVCGAREDKDENGFPRLVQTGLTANRLKEVEGTTLTRCRERVSPSIAPLVEELPGATPDRRILVFMQPATNQAHTFRRREDGGKHFVRVSRSTIEARNGLLRDLLVRKGALEPWDMRPCPGATVEDLDLLAIRDAFQRMHMEEAAKRPDVYLSEREALSPFVPPLCMREPLTGILRPRNFTMLLFGRQPQRFVGGAVSSFSVYPGKDRSEPVARRNDFAGTILHQAQSLWALVSEQSTTIFDKANLKNPNIETYPQRALQEALINALAHRDYSTLEPTRITVFLDRIEFASPGGLPLGVTLTGLRRGEVTPKWRNRGLAWFFRKLELAQAEGQGIPTIQRAMKAAGCPPPKFEASQVEVVCTLRANPRAVSIQRTIGRAFHNESRTTTPARRRTGRG